MDTLTKLTNDLFSPYWWLSVVVVGLLVNLVSAYVKGPMDRWMERRFDSRRLESEQRRKERQAWINALSSDPQLLALELQSELRNGIAVVIYSLGLVFVLLIFTSRQSGLPGTAQVLLGFISGMVCIIFLIRSVRQADIHYKNIEMTKRLILSRW